MLQGAAYDAIRSDSRLDFGFVFADCIRLLAPDCLVDPQIQEGCPADKAPASRAVHMKCYRNIWKEHIIAWWFLGKVKQYRHISLSLSVPGSTSLHHRWGKVSGRTLETHRGLPCSVHLQQHSVGHGWTDISDINIALFLFSRSSLFQCLRKVATWLIYLSGTPSPTWTFPLRTLHPIHHCLGSLDEFGLGFLRKVQVSACKALPDPKNVRHVHVSKSIHNKSDHSVFRSIESMNSIKNSQSPNWCCLPHDADLPCASDGRTQLRIQQQHLTIVPR